MKATTSTFRSRLLLAMGFGPLAAASMLGCGSDNSTRGGSAGAAGAAGAMALGGNAGGGGETSSGGSAGAGGSAGVGGSAVGSGGNGGSAGAETHICEPWPLCATVRRPFLVGADMRSSRVAERDDWSERLADVEITHARTREFLAQSWLKDALEEHASIAAFARFTMLLLSVGAPPDLAIGSQRASLDEVRHARACFSLARRYGAREVGPSELIVADSLSAMSLADVLELTVAEGCVGETLGALLAAEQLRFATDPEVRRILQRIAKDELRHAELAWTFLAWALRTDPRLGEAAVRAFQRTTREIERMPVVDYGVDVDVWHAHGRVTCAEARDVARVGIERIVGPCLQAILGESPAPLAAPAVA